MFWPPHYRTKGGDILHCEFNIIHSVNFAYNYLYITTHAHKLYTIIYLVNKTNRRTELQFYLYYDSTCFGQPFCPSSGVLSRTSVLVHVMQIWWPFATRSRMELQFLIPIRLEFSASVGFIHKEFVTMHGQTILKFKKITRLCCP